MKKIALIFGITGQDGSYLAEFLLKKKYIVHGVKRRSSSINTGRIDHIYQDPHIENNRFFLHFGDLKSKQYTVKKLSTENNELYGSVKPTEISKIILENDKIEIKPSMIQLMNDIKSLGEFEALINLHSEVDAEIIVNVTSADTIQ